MSSLPRGWALVKLGDVVSPRAVKVAPSQIPDQPFIGLENVEAHSGRILSCGRTGDMKSNVAWFEAGDILYSRLRPYLNKVISPNFSGGASAEFIVFPQSEAIVSGFLHARLMHTDFLQFVAHLDEGDRPRVDFEQFKDFKLLLPPVAEQKRIIVKLAELRKRINAARSETERAAKLNRRYKEAILLAAFGGQLSAEWREGFQVSPWKTVPAAEACEVVQSGSTPPKERFRETPGVPYLKVYNIVDQKVAFEAKPQFIDGQTHQQKLGKSIVKPGDVLMNIVGPPLGKVAMVPDVYPEWNINQAIVVFRPKASLLPKFLYHLLCSGLPYQDTLNETRGSAGQVNISLTQCREMEFHIPSIEEQEVVLAKLDKAFAACAKSEEELCRANALLNRLYDALSERAFTGQLVPRVVVRES